MDEDQPLGITNLLTNHIKCSSKHIAVVCRVTGTGWYYRWDVYGNEASTYKPCINYVG